MKSVWKTKCFSLDCFPGICGIYLIKGLRKSSLLSCFDNNIHSLPVSIDLLGAGNEDVETIVSFIPGIVAEFVDFILNN